MKALLQWLSAIIPRRHYRDPELEQLRHRMREAKTQLKEATCNHERTVVQFRSDPSIQRLAGGDCFGLDSLGGAMNGVSEGMSTMGDNKKANSK